MYVRRPARRMPCVTSVRQAPSRCGCLVCLQYAPYRSSHRLLRPAPSDLLPYHLRRRAAPCHLLAPRPLWPAPLRAVATAPPPLLPPAVSPRSDAIGPVGVAFDLIDFALTAINSTVREADSLREAADSAAVLSAEEYAALLRLQKKWVATVVVGPGGLVAGSRPWVGGVPYR